MFEAINAELIAAKPAFLSVAPGPGGALKAASNVGRAYKCYTMIRGFYKQFRSGSSVAQVTGGMAAGKVRGRISRPVTQRVHKTHIQIPQMAKRDRYRKNGLGGRSWITEAGVYEMVIIYHDANRAGPHIDVHIGHLSLVYRVKPDLQEKLKFNREGYLTEASKEAILQHVRSEVSNHSRVPQNLDHSPTNARMQWVGGDPTSREYGSGVTRQIVSVSNVDVYKAYADGPIEFYAPVLNSSKSLYLYRIYPGDGSRAPICIFGEKSRNPPKLEERLHLRMVDPSDLPKLQAGKADMSTSTAKYDGSSCYIVISPKGTIVWGPRVSKRTGRQIEYTHKLRGVHTTTNSETIVAMGEVLFLDEEHWGKKSSKTGHGNVYLPSATGGGILNSNDVLPSNIKPEIRIYRVDKVGRTDTHDLPFWENRALQEEVAALNPGLLKVVELMPPEEALRLGYEGVVVIPPDASVNDGYKVKWWQDPNDWVIDRVAFTRGEKGGVAGVVFATSLDSGKSFKLGSGQVGDRALTEHMMTYPDDYEGVVLKVQSREGHEGRAAKVMAIHDDKGMHVQAVS